MREFVVNSSRKWRYFPTLNLLGAIQHLYLTRPYGRYTNYGRFQHVSLLILG